MTSDIIRVGREVQNSPKKGRYRVGKGTSMLFASIYPILKRKKNASSLFNSVTIYMIPRMGRNFDDFSDFPKKARAV